MSDNLEYDVIVVGSGGGALLSAVRAHDLGMKVLVIEKSDRYGGTTATSGGVLWMPLNDQIDDDFKSAYTYLKAAVGDTTTDGKVRAYLESAPEMIRYVNEKTSVRYLASPDYPDYYQDMPCARPGGRSMESVPFDGSLLGDELFKLREPHPGVTLMGVSMTATESNTLATKGPGWLWVTIRTMGRYYLDFAWRRKTKRDRRLCLGNSLIGGLRHSMLQRNIPLWLECPLESLVRENDRVQGVVARRNGQPVTLRARRGVILAAGGFERNQEMREQYLPRPTRQEWSSTPKLNNTGDTIRAAQAIGAKLENMHLVWGTPSVQSPAAPQGQQPIFVERGQGGFVAVNNRGKRFVNEALSYDRFQTAMYEDHKRTGGSIPTWLVFDAKFRKDCAMGPFLPGSVFPDSKIPKEWIGDFFFKDDTLEGLARQIGVSPEGLADTVRRNNEYAKTGVDPEFNRGGSAHDLYWANKRRKPNPCLAPIDTAPYYAIKALPSDTGTKGGPAITDDAQVLDQSDRPIPGLYCIGNNSSAALGRAYAGAGGTIGPGMVFGFRAANHLAKSS
jgi:3-oxosteroid 1-dehydrogenase